MSWKLGRPPGRLLTALAAVMLVGGAGLGVGLTDTAHAAVTATEISVPAPPMGWASWNAFGAKIDADVIKKQADALVSSGLAAAGYQYVNIDEGWWQGTRDGDGNITVDEKEWPGGMKAIADYIHSKGLKAGIYTDAGKDGCGYYFPTGRPAAPGSGSEGHYEQDFRAFSTWGFDFVKVDWCGGDKEGLDPAATFQAINTAVTKASAATGRPLILSICNWGRNNPWNWAPGLGTMWRTGDDIIGFRSWNEGDGDPVLYPATLGQVLTSFDKAQHATAQHTGYLNDPDMLTVGLPGLSDSDARTEMSLWAVSGAPLLAGNILTTMTPSTAEILTNREVIAVDQDPRGLPGVKVAEDKPGLQVYAKVLAGSGKRAVVLLNRTSTAAPMMVRWTDLGLTNGPAQVGNVWTAGDLGSKNGSYEVSVPANGSVMLTVTGTEAGATTYEAETGGNTLAGSAKAVACADCSGGSKVGEIGNGSANILRFNGVKADATGLAVVELAYASGDTATRTATMNVNGQVGTVVAFPPTGSWTNPGTVSVVVSLRKGSANSVTFSNAAAWAPDLDALAVSPIPGAAGTEVLGAGSGRCLDIFNNSIGAGTQTELWDCSGGANQTWAYTSSKQFVVYGNKCLDAWDWGTTDGTKATIWDCTGGANQQWNVNADGTITSVLSGLCLDARNGTTNGSLLVLWTCDSSAGQQWTVDSAVLTTPPSASTSASASASASASSPAPTQPAGTFTLDRTAVWAGQAVQLTMSRVAGASRIVVNWGDCGSTTMPPNNVSVAHTYTKAGTFPVEVTVFGADGAGQPVTAGTVKVTKDTYKPVVSLTAPRKADRASSWKKATGTATDKGRGVGSVRIKLIQKRSGTWHYYTGKVWVKASSQRAASAKAKVVTATLNAKGGWSLGLKGVKKGTLKIAYWGNDKVGNTSTLKIYTKKITR